MSDHVIVFCRRKIMNNVCNCPNTSELFDEYWILTDTVILLDVRLCNQETSQKPLQNIIIITHQLQKITLDIPQLFHELRLSLLILFKMAWTPNKAFRSQISAIALKNDNSVRLMNFLHHPSLHTSPILFNKTVTGSFKVTNKVWALKQNSTAENSKTGWTKNMKGLTFTSIQNSNMPIECIPFHFNYVFITEFTLNTHAEGE